jgi:ankyrin repeat protein
MNSRAFASILAFLFLDVPLGSLAVTGQVPACRLDTTIERVVSDASSRIVGAYAQLGIALPFDSVDINVQNDQSNRRLAIYLIKDARQDGVDEKSCILTARSTPDSPPLDGLCVPTRLRNCSRSQLREMRRRNDQMGRFGLAGACYLTNTQACTESEMGKTFDNIQRDPLTVKGGCVTSIIDGRSTIQCSAGAIKILQTDDAQQREPSAALLFVLAHEMFHVIQANQSAYSGTDSVIDLSASATVKRTQLKQKCDRAPALGDTEDAADAAALRVLTVLWPWMQKKIPPSISRNNLVDQIGFGASYLDQYLHMWNDGGPVIHHPAFEINVVDTDTSVPYTEPDNSAKVFFCDVMRPGRGNMAIPLYHGDHSRLATRMKNISSRLTVKATHTKDPMGDLRTFNSTVFADVDRAIDHAELIGEERLCQLTVEPPDCAAVDEEMPADALNTILHASAWRGDSRLTEQLLLAGNPVTATNSKGSTPLFFAVFNSKLAVVNQLLDAGADPNAANVAGLRPLCIIGGEAVSLLSRDLFGDTTGFEDRDEIGVKLINFGADPKVECPVSITLRAIIGEQMNTLKRLLASGIDPNKELSEGETPIAVAIGTKSTGAIELLVAAGADINAQDSEGETPMHLAAMLGQADSVDFLLSKGARTDLKDKEGHTALDVACINKKSEVADMLMARRAPFSVQVCVR